MRLHALSHTTINPLRVLRVFLLSLVHHYAVTKLEPRVSKPENDTALGHDLRGLGKDRGIDAMRYGITEGLPVNVDAVVGGQHCEGICAHDVLPGLVLGLLVCVIILNGVEQRALFNHRTHGMIWCHPREQRRPPLFLRQAHVHW